VLLALDVQPGWACLQPKCCCHTPYLDPNCFARQPRMRCVVAIEL